MPRHICNDIFMAESGRFKALSTVTVMITHERPDEQKKRLAFEQSERC
jgi:hypothetical protein